MKTKVIFRKFKNGDIIALFPEEVGVLHSYCCTCYEHVGQHGSADYTHIVHMTKLAVPEEYANLKNELESTPYFYDLDVKHKCTSAMWDTFLANRHSYLIA
jgi:hypothetical protein